MFRRRCIAVLLFCVIFLPVCRAQRAHAGPEKRLILSGEAVEIKVESEPELSVTGVVQPDGRITLPLVNSVQAAGLTVKQLQVQLEKRLKQYVEQPRVTVAVVGMTERLHIWGAPETPRPWPLPDLWPVR